MDFVKEHWGKLQEELILHMEKMFEKYSRNRYLDELTKEFSKFRQVKNFNITLTYLAPLYFHVATALHVYVQMICDLEVFLRVKS